MVAQPPGNRQKELDRKLLFYGRYGVEEYYLYDPDKNDLSGWLRSQGQLDVIEDVENWVSPRLQIRFELTEETLQLYHPDGEKFASTLEVEQKLQRERQRAEQAETELEQTTVELEQECQKTEEAVARAERLEKLLREAGIDPEQID